MSLVYIFCKRNPNQQFRFMMFFLIKAKYFPLAYAAFQILLGRDWKDLVFGLLVGHVYLYFKELLPLSTGKTYIWTPAFMYINNLCNF
jgi:hypothetical protein